MAIIRRFGCALLHNGKGLFRSPLRLLGWIMKGLAPLLYIKLSQKRWKCASGHQRSFLALREQAALSRKDLRNIRITDFWRRCRVSYDTVPTCLVLITYWADWVREWPEIGSSCTIIFRKHALIKIFLFSYSKFMAICHPQLRTWCSELLIYSYCSNYTILYSSCYSSC